MSKEFNSLWLEQYQAKSKSHENHNFAGEPSGSKSEQVIRHEPLAEAQGETGNAAGIQVRITSYRRRLLDPDNLAGGCKYFVDCCRYAHLIPDDRPQDIELITRQVKVKKKSDEHTLIELFTNKIHLVRSVAEFLEVVK